MQTGGTDTNWQDLSAANSWQRPGRPTDTTTQAQGTPARKHDSACDTRRQRAVTHPAMSSTQKPGHLRSKSSTDTRGETCHDMSGARNARNERQQTQMQTQWHTPADWQRIVLQKQATPKRFASRATRQTTEMLLTLAFGTVPGRRMQPISYDSFKRTGRKQRRTFRETVPPRDRVRVQAQPSVSHGQENKVQAATKPPKACLLCRTSCLTVCELGRHPCAPL